MASAKLLNSLIKPLMQRRTNLVRFDNMLFFQPIGWYLRGCMFGRFGWPGGKHKSHFCVPVCHSAFRAAYTR